MMAGEDEKKDQDDIGEMDGLSNDDDAPFVSYDIAVYPSDYTLSVLEQMWKEGDIKVPEFQRKFVWTIRQSSLLIESMLMGLPVPQGFFFVEPDGRFLVIDGLQRIMSVVYFFSGFFGDENYQGSRKVFRLTGLSDKSPYSGKSFSELADSDRRKLKNSVLRVINVKQLGPKDGDTSAYHIFERLNTGGTPLTAQEIRHCVFHGALVGVLGELNRDANWRKILGKKNFDRHQKDVELLLRVLAFSRRAESYEKPMKEFLNSTMSAYKSAAGDEIEVFKENFPLICARVVSEIGEKPFSPKGRLNASALDSILGTLISNFERLPEDLKPGYRALMKDEEFTETLSVSTSDTAIVRDRLAAVRKHFIPV